MAAEHSSHVKKEKKETFRKCLQDFVSERHGAGLGSLNDKQRSLEMTRFYVNRILRTLNLGIVPEDEEDLDACIVDGAGDQGIDFISVEDGRVLLIQSKYRGRSNAKEKREDFISFCEVLTRIHPEDGKQYKKNSKLREALSEIDWNTDSFELHYITLGRASSDIRERANHGVSAPASARDVADRSELYFYDEPELNLLFREADTVEGQVKGEVILRLSSTGNEPPWITYQNQDGKRSSYTGRITARRLDELYRQHRTRLFSLNIRNYIGDNRTNKQIARCASEEPENFFFYNNGISAVATKITPDIDKGTLSCERFSIVNGAQTVRSLSKAHADHGDKVKDAEVLIRVSKVSWSRNDRDQGFLSNVTRYNNTQNVIKVADFRSNDAVQTSLKRHFAPISRGGKMFRYDNKRSKPDRQYNVIKMEEFVKTIFAFRFGSHEAFGGTGYLFDNRERSGNTEEGGYRKLFGDHYDEPLSKDEFHLYAGIWFVCEEARAVWRELKPDKESKEAELIESMVGDGLEEKRVPMVKSALERRWMLYYALGELLRNRYKTDDCDLQTDLKSLGNPKRMEDTRCRAAIRDYTDTACDVLIRVYFTSARGPDFTQRNWFRSKGTLADIKREVAMSGLLVRNLSLLTGK